MKSFVNQKVLFLFLGLILSLSIGILFSFPISNISDSTMEGLEDEKLLIPMDMSMNSAALFPPVHDSALFTLNHLHHYKHKSEDHKDETINDMLKDTVIETKIIPNITKNVKNYIYNPKIYYPVQDFQNSAIRRPLERFRKEYPNSERNIETLERLLFTIMFDVYSQMKSGKKPNYHHKFYEMFRLKVEPPKNPTPVQPAASNTMMNTLNKQHECRFDAKAYSNKYRDLQNAFHGDEKRLREHWLRFGIHEGRSPCGDINPKCRFDAETYSKIYPDLQRVFHGNEEQLKHHYVHHGIYQHRMICNDKQEPPPRKPHHYRWIWSDGKDGKYTRGYHWVSE
jgi:hypothetical protein